MSRKPPRYAHFPLSTLYRRSLLLIPVTVTSLSKISVAKRIRCPEYVHNVVDHAETYVRGHIHANGLENFWSLLKRGIHGTYVSVEPYHLFRCLDEQAFRFNERESEDKDRLFYQP
jgi:hypothetical protein